MFDDTVQMMSSEAFVSERWISCNFTAPSNFLLDKGHMVEKCVFIITFYWLPKLHKIPYKSRFILNSLHCSTTILSKHITSALTVVKAHNIEYSETAFSHSIVNYFGP